MPEEKVLHGNKFAYNNSMLGEYNSEGDLVIVTVEGEIDVFSSPTLKSAMKELVEDHGTRKMIVDLEKVDFIDSSGLGVLVSTLRRLKDLQENVGPIPLQLVTTRDALKKVFRITGLDRVYQIHASIDEAIENFKPSA
jgi:anti-sigma B factor antagonist